MLAGVEGGLGMARVSDMDSMAPHWLTFWGAFVGSLTGILFLAALAYRLTTPRPGPQPAAQCYDLFEGLCRW